MGTPLHVLPLALALLATAARASPQAAPLAQNLTATATTTDGPAPPLRPHPESTAGGWGEGATTALASNCDSPDACSTTQMLVHVETSVTGFEQLSNVVLQPIGGATTTPGKTVEVVTTSTPSLVNIHTELAPTTTPQEPGVAPSETPGADGTPGNSATPSEQPGDSSAPEDSPTPGESPTHGNSPTPGDSPTPGESQTTSAPNSLLNEIVSHIGLPVSSTDTGSNSADDRLPSSSEADMGHQIDPSQPSGDAQFQQATGAEPGPSISPVGSAPTMTAGSQITMGSATLTLTPGLSSVLGDGATATYVAINTDDAGQTLITVSSSGTAVTATITNAPVTLTKAITGSKASVTTPATPASGDSTGADRTAASTSSQGLGTHQKAELGQWLYVGMGLAGLGLVVG